MNEKIEQVKDTRPSLYVNGCSYTFGIGLEVEKIPDSRWSSLLANKLNFAEQNSAWPGSSNFRISRQTFTDILPMVNKPALAVIMWSDPVRQEFFRPQQNENKWQDLAQITPQSVGSIRSYYHKEAFESFFAFISTEERALVHTLHHMLSVQTLFSFLNIPAIHFHYKSNFNSHYTNVLSKAKESKAWPYRNLLDHINSATDELLKLNRHTFGFKDSTSFANLTKTNRIPTSNISLGHPSDAGYKMMADWFYNYIVSNNDLSERVQLHVRG